ncbi:serine/threonine-protein phosphatase 7 long form-like protein [Senna tora]|uniref:Serine/threonine-protein phosphatase 7 long form-like protein n=1 Tax=Senna tora TaxID=362788 RepID=A0A834TUL4_9FABA|nr:serine/threonine-protein phosphatase 7 long form-like protein [Senna tora]
MAASQRRRMIKPGLEDPSLLSLQSRHVSEAVWHGYPERTMRFRRWKGYDVKGWRPETHIFHLPQGECTITLKDVATQLGLPWQGIPVCGLTGLRDLEQARSYSWGSAVLAHLYRKLCNATNKNQKEIAGCQTLVHMWAWDRFPWLAPKPLPYHDPHDKEYVVPPPLRIRWSSLHWSLRPPLTI